MFYTSRLLACASMITAATVVRSEDVSFLMTHVMYKCSFRWREIGLSLSFQPYELDNISSSSPTSSTQQYLAQLLSQWCQWPTTDHSASPTMERLWDALHSGMVGLGAAAQELYNLIAHLPSQNN